MKNYIIFLTTLLFCCISCNDHEIRGDEPITEADLFLASDEFKQFEQVIINDSRITRNALMALTVEEREQYFSLMKKATPNITNVEYDSIVAEIKRITGIDTDARLRKLHNAKIRLFSKTTFSKTDLLKAMQRQCLNIKNITLTRSTDEINSSDCLHSCENIYAAVYRMCDSTDGYGPGLVLNEEDYKIWYQTRYCEMQAMEAFDECAVGCQ